MDRVPHGMRPCQLRAGTWRATEPQSIVPSPAKPGGTLPWLILALGLGVFACGAALMGLSLAKDSTPLWQLGLPMVLGGQVAVLFVVIWQLDVVWHSNRATFVALHAMDEQLRQLRLHAPRTGESTGGKRSFNICPKRQPAHCSTTCAPTRRAPTRLDRPKTRHNVTCPSPPRCPGRRARPRAVPAIPNSGESNLVASGPPSSAALLRNLRARSCSPSAYSIMPTRNSRSALSGFSSALLREGLQMRRFGQADWRHRGHPDESRT